MCQGLVERADNTMGVVEEPWEGRGRFPIIITCNTISMHVVLLEQWDKSV